MLAFPAHFYLVDAFISMLAKKVRFGTREMKISEETIKRLLILGMSYHITFKSRS